MSPAFPNIGKFDNPMTIVGGMGNLDAAEGALITTTLYGTSMTYMYSQVAGMKSVGGTVTQALIMRFD